MKIAKDTATLLLASGSPRRRQLLALLAVPFDLVSPDVGEDTGGGGNARDTALLLARLKAEAAGDQAQGKLVIGADTLVVLRGEVMGKPPDADTAAAMLRALRGREHQVISGLAVLDAASGTTTLQAVESRVWMRDYQDDEIADYIARGEPFDKAGGYAIQDRLFRPVHRIEGCYANVMGLPLCHLYRILKESRVAVANSPRRACEEFTHRRCLAAAEILGKQATMPDNH